MAVILNIETSTSVCSVALSAEGMILRHHEDFQGRNHAALLSGFIKDCLDFLKDKDLKPEAIAVSMGPGSYTGLRIGLSEAKGLAYALGIPVIGICTLKLMATGVMFSRDDISSESVLVPMIDARRMEVYTAAYDFSLEPIMPPRPLILDKDSYSEILSSGRPVLFFGDGSEKARELLSSDNAIFIPEINPLATDMLAPAELAYSRKEFIDIAYSVPEYLKEFQTTRPKKLI